MLNLVHFTVNALAAANVYGLANITIGYSDIILAYIVAIVVSIIVALLLSDRYSFDVSAIYPTPIFAIGILSLFLVLDYTFAFNGLLLAAIIGVCSGLFVKYLFYYIFPSPSQDGDMNE